jgi:hypothetical protein
MRLDVELLGELVLLVPLGRAVLLDIYFFEFVHVVFHFEGGEVIVHLKFDFCY